MATFLSVLVGSIFSVGLIAGPKQSPKVKKSRTPKMIRPEELRGSKEQRIRQNIKAASLKIDQIATADELWTLAIKQELVEVTDSEYYFVDRGSLPKWRSHKGKKNINCPPRESRILVRRWVKKYLDKHFNLIARDFMKEFGKKLKLTSGARSLAELVLMRTRSSCYYTVYAAQVSNSLEESLHGRAIAIDVSRRVSVVVGGKLKEMAMSRREIEWMRKRLITDKSKGVEVQENQEFPLMLEVEPIEENICYHIVVFPK